MTRENAIKKLSYIADEMPSMECADWKEAIYMAIETLEQEPCEDAISREEAIDACNQSVNILEATDRIKDLPPVTPQEPFMNKPCVAHQVCHEDKVKILDKIRAEIDIARFVDKDTKLCKNANASGLEVALKIIDRYTKDGE